MTAKTPAAPVSVTYPLNEAAAADAAWTVHVHIGGLSGRWVMSAAGGRADAASEKRIAYLGPSSVLATWSSPMT
jgi:hypothetical protein